MLKFSAIVAITLLLIVFATLQVQAQGTPDGVPPPPPNATGGGGIIFDPLTPPWATCNDPASIEIKFPPGIIDANLADVFRLEPQVRFICGGETKIFYNWTISPPPPRTLFRGPPPMGPEPPKGHERALIIPAGVLEGDKIYEVALVAYGRVNASDLNPIIQANVSAFIRGRRVRPSIFIRGGLRRAARVGSPARIGVESAGLQDVFDRYQINCCKLSDPMDPKSDCDVGNQCANVTFDNFFNPSANFASRFNRTIQALNFTEPGLYRILAQINWEENGTARHLNFTQIVEAFDNSPFDSVSVVAPRNDLFEGEPAFLSVAVARRGFTERNRTTNVSWTISGNKGPNVNITRPPVRDNFRLRVEPQEIESLNDPLNGKAFIEVRVSLNDANAPPGAPRMTVTDRVFLRPQPDAECTVARSSFDPDFSNATVTAFRSGRSRLNVSISGVDRAEFEDITFNLLLDLQSPDGRNHTVSMSPGAEANDRAFQDFAVGYIRGNPEGKATVAIELGAYGRAFRKIRCGEFSLFRWNSANPQEILGNFDRFHRRARNAVQEKDFRALHESINDMVGVLSVTPANFVTNFPNLATQMGLFLNALSGMILNRDAATQQFLVENIAGPGREAIIRFVYEAVRLFKNRWAGNSYMTTSLPGMLIKLATAEREQNIPDLRAVGRDVMEIFNIVGAGMPRNLRFRFLQQIIRVFGSKESAAGPGASDDSPVNLGSNFRADVLTFAGANAAANKTYNCSGGDMHVKPSTNQFENIADEDSVSIAVGRTSASLFGLAGTLASDIFDINSLVDSVTQSVSGLPANDTFEFRIPCPPRQDCKKIRCTSFDDATDRWVEIPTRLAAPLRNGTEVPQAPEPAPGASAPSNPPAGTYPPDIICSTTHLSVFSLTVSSSDSGSNTTSAAGSPQTFIITLFSTVMTMFAFGVLML